MLSAVVAVLVRVRVPLTPVLADQVTVQLERAVTGQVLLPAVRSGRDRHW